MADVIHVPGIVITGHREYGDPSALYRGLDQLRAGNEYIFGGARGTDTDALNYMARTQPNVSRTVIVPNRVTDQPQVAREAINRHATRVIELRRSGPDRYMIRNKAMVNRGNHVRAFYDGRGKGGTFNTIEYAKSQGKPVTITDVNSKDINEFVEQTPTELKKELKSMRDHRVRQRSGKGLVCSAIRRFSPAVGKDIMAFLHELQDQEPKGIV